MYIYIYIYIYIRELGRAMIILNQNYWKSTTLLLQVLQHKRQFSSNKKLSSSSNTLTPEKVWFVTIATNCCF